MDASNDIVSAVNRFGLGAQPGELERVPAARDWLDAQIASGANGEQTLAALPSSLDYLKRESRYKLEKRRFKQDADDRAENPERRALLTGNAQAMNPAAANGSAVAAAEAQKNKSLPPEVRAIQRDLRDDLFAEAAARFRLAATTDTPFMERLVHFWSNHFAVSLDKGPARLFAAPMEREAIRPHVNGRFADMLLAVETHPAMLRYLDNVQSTGPDSPLGERISARLARNGGDDRGKAGGLNENLGREIMELHTLGVNGGYSQADVTEFSRALTGWSTPLPRQFQMGVDDPRVGGNRRGRLARFADAAPPDSAFVFRAAAHEPGSRKVLGKTYAESGFEQGRAILLDLARNPATAKHLSLQLARHFVADAPPQSLVDRMAKSYLDHDTDLAAVYSTLIASPEAWGAKARKFKTPQDFVISSLRAGSIDAGDNPKPFLSLLNTLGEPMFTPRSPAGFPDIASNWIDADALWKRVQAAEALSQRVALATMRPMDLAAGVLGPALDAETAGAIKRAESVQVAVATLFASPAFQWRA